MKFLLSLFLIAGCALAQDATTPTFSTADPDATRFETMELVGTSATRACSFSTVSVTRTSGTALSVGAGASSTAPQEVRFGTKTRAITTALTLTLASGTGTGTVNFYGQLQPDGTMKLVAEYNDGNTYTFTAGLLQSLPGPAVANPKVKLFSWPVTAGAFASSGSVDFQLNRDCWIDLILLSNFTGSAATVTLTDNQGTPLNMLNAVSIAANSTSLIVFPGGIFVDSGMQINASATSSIQAKWRGAIKRQTETLP